MTDRAISRASGSNDRWAPLFVAAGVLLRLMPHPWNVTPLTAVALFSGAHLKTPRGLAALFGALLLSDFVLGFHVTMPFTWGAVLIVIAIGRRFNPSGISPRLAGSCLAGSFVFYIVTNLGVFLLQSMYPKTFQGLLECYAMALPFFRNSIAGDLFYSFLLFGLYQTAQIRIPARASAAGPTGSAGAAPRA